MHRDTRTADLSEDLTEALAGKCALDDSLDHDYAALTPAVLGQLSREHGVDAATALWYERVRSAEPHRAFIEGVEAVDAGAALPPTPARLLVAPAAFWREY